MLRRRALLVQLSRALALASVIIAAWSCDRAASGAAPPPPRQLALTFDDAPRGDGAFMTGPERTQALISALDAVGVRGAMFFVVTENVAKHGGGAARLRAYAEAGHVLANHSHSHPSLQAISPADFLADVDAASEILTDLPATAPYFRYPYLHEGRTAEERAEMEAALAERGLRNGYVTVDTYEWYMAALAEEAVRAGHPPDRDALRDAYVETLVANIEFYDAIARDTLGRSPRHVLLLHENDLTAMFVDDLVRALRREGWEVIPALDAYADPIAERAPDTDFNGQGRVAALAAEAGRAPRDLFHESEDEEFLRAEFARRGLLAPAR